MYTQTQFQEFLERVLAETEAEFGVQWHRLSVVRKEALGDWLYDVFQMDVEISRWAIRGKEMIMGPALYPPESQAEFETRFQKEFRAGMAQLARRS